MNVTWDSGAATKEDHLRGCNLMMLPLETLHHVLSFLSTGEILSFAFVCRRAFEVAKGLTWERLDLSVGSYWLKDVDNLCDRAQTTCRNLFLPTRSECVR
jgi:hypothetical protein